MSKNIRTAYFTETGSLQARKGACCYLSFLLVLEGGRPWRRREERATTTTDIKRTCFFSSKARKRATARPTRTAAPRGEPSKATSPRKSCHG